MYCPKCATQNAEGARFCRACGADISLIPQALTGQLPAKDSDEDAPGHRRSKKHKGREAPSIEHGIKNLFMGIAFVLVSFAVRFYAPGGSVWWFWMLIPAFALGGTGVGQIAAAMFEQKKATATGALASPPYTTPTAVPPAPRATELPPSNPSTFPPKPASVTEGTTRHLDMSARPFGSTSERAGDDRS